MQCPKCNKGLQTRHDGYFVCRDCGEFPALEVIRYWKDMEASEMVAVQQNVQQREVIQFGWACALLKRKASPFREQYQEHFVVQPKELSQEDDERFSNLLAGIGWRYSKVAIFKKQNGEAFYAWQCIPE